MVSSRNPRSGSSSLDARYADDVMDRVVVLFRMATVAANAYFVAAGVTHSAAALGAVIGAVMIAYAGLFLLKRWVNLKMLNLAFVPVGLVAISIAVSLTNGIDSNVYLLYVVEVIVVALYAGLVPSLSVGLVASILYGLVLWPALDADWQRWTFFYRATMIVLTSLGVGFIGAFLRQRARVLAHQGEELGRRLEATRSLGELVRKIGEHLDLQAVFDEVLASATRLMGGEGGAIVIRKPETDTFCVAAGQGVEAIPVNDLEPWRTVIQSTKTVVLPARHPHGPQRKGTEGDSWTGAIFTPVVEEGEITGWIGVYGILADCPPTPDQLEGLGILAGNAAIAMSNARLYAAATKRARRLEILYQIGRSMSSNLHPERLYERVHHEISKILDLEAFYIALYHKGSESVEIPFLADERGQYPPQQFRINNGPTSRVLRSGKPLLINREPEEPIPGATRVFRENSQEEPRSILIVPMLLDGNVMGALSVQSYREAAYDHEDQEMLEAIAAQAAICVENARLYRQAAEMSYTDFLTGLGNARRFHDELDKSLARSDRTGQPVSIIMIDSDSLKRVNDEHGHLAGDRLITQVAAAIQGTVRMSDSVVRYAGDEFLAILPDTDQLEAVRVAERIREQVEQADLELFGKNLLSTVSIGVATYPTHADSGRALLRAADEAMYRSKREGKNRVTGCTTSD